MSGHSAESDALWWSDIEGPRAVDSWACNADGEWHWHPGTVQDHAEVVARLARVTLPAHHDPGCNEGCTGDSHLLLDTVGPTDREARATPPGGSDA